MPSEARPDVYPATQGRNSGDESVAFFGWFSAGMQYWPKPGLVFSPNASHTQLFQPLANIQLSLLLSLSVCVLSWLSHLNPPSSSILLHHPKREVPNTPLPLLNTV